MDRCGIFFPHEKQRCHVFTQVPAENSSRVSEGVDGIASLAVPALDGDSTHFAGQGTTADSEGGTRLASPIDGGGTPHSPTHPTDGLPLIRQRLRDRGISQAGTDIILASWRPATARKYQPHINRWLQFCGSRNIDPFAPTVTNTVTFLSVTFHRGVSYTSINTARGALSSLRITVDGCSAGSHPFVTRFLKGVFNLRPSVPRYTRTWDVQQVLQHLRAMDPLSSLSLKDLTLKLVVLMALTQAARIQTLHYLLLKNINFGQDSVCVWLGETIKQCRPKFNVRFMTLKAYSTDIRLCVCETLKMYIARTEEFRNSAHQENGKLLLSFIKPHKHVTRDTVARWIRTVLSLSGIDSSQYSTGSVRPAAASKAKAMALPIGHIMARAGWSRVATFAKFYDKEIVPSHDPFQDAVLQ
ncbi:uncharacterized protein [Panulirus ornatus]|uniref:uncharacterized protein n=1 Tax=Panulirus ornatus TaxID=150431 RepID=UPI003A83CCBA